MKDTTVFERFTELHFKNEVGLYCCGKRINTPNHKSRPENRNHYLFILVNKGKSVISGDREVYFGEHDLLIMHPDKKIYYKALGDWSISWIGLYGDTVSDYMDLLGVTPENPLLHISLYKEMKMVMDKIYDASKDTSFSSKLSVTGLIYEFFAILIRNSELNPKTELVNSALNLIDYNFCADISIEQIAEHLSVTPAHFSRKFTERIGISPKEYILKKRIERAKELLITTDSDIFEIANFVGYEDQFYFSRIFKKYTGYSPSQYRKKNRV